MLSLYVKREATSEHEGEGKSELPPIDVIERWPGNIFLSHDKGAGNYSEV